MRQQSLIQLHLPFIHECISERIIKIGQHLLKLSQTIKVGRFFETQCIIDVISCVVLGGLAKFGEDWSKTVATVLSVDRCQTDGHTDTMWCYILSSDRQ